MPLAMAREPARLMQVSHWTWVTLYGYRSLQEQVNQRVNYYYDVNAFDTTGFSQNTWGRLAASCGTTSSRTVRRTSTTNTATTPPAVP
ncbi:MAG TPA: hypothetical protein VFA04_16685 [Bryobacteraceae bacterium]|nr:hypothetical protein [Bryobacteraceae bacterium]